MLKNILGFITIFGLATVWIYVLYLMSGSDDRLKFPTSLDDIAVLSELLKYYSENHLSYIVVLFCSVYIYKQAFAIPGSIFLNLLAGSLFGPYRGFVLCSILSSCGATSCFLLSKYITYPVIKKCFPRKLRQFQDMVNTRRSNLFFFLLSLRLFPMTPNWLLNMCSPLARVPLQYFYFSVLLGLAPYNFLTSQAGSVLGDIKSMDDIISMKILIGLSLLAVAILGPALVKKKSGET